VKKYIKVLFLISQLFLLPAIAAVANKDSVNILTWWGYLDYPEVIQKIEQDCDVKITHDNYYSNEEFLRRWQGHKEYYDVIIFSDTIYGVVKPNLPDLSKSTLWQQSAEYHPVIKSHYLSKHYPHNVVYFVHAMTGFLWNPENIKINENDSIVSIFKKANGKLVVLMDDPVEAKKLVTSAENGDQLTIANFNRVIQDANVYVTNNYSQIYKKPNFAFSYSWSGEAVIDLMAANKEYKFLVHPKLSYVTSDLLAQTSTSRGATCVAKELAGKKLATEMQENMFYFAPYKNMPVSKNRYYDAMHRNFIANLSMIPWLEYDKSQFDIDNRNWQLIKLPLNTKKT